MKDQLLVRKYQQFRLALSILRNALSFPTHSNTCTQHL